MKRLHVISHSYPSEAAPFDATFVADHLKFMSSELQVSGSVIRPYALPFSTKRKKNSSRLISYAGIEAESIPYLSFPGKRFPRQIQKNLIKKVRRSRYISQTDLFHVHFLYPGGLLIPFLKRETGLPVVLTIHGEDWYQTRSRRDLNEILYQCLNKCDAIVAVGPSLKTDISETYPELSEKVILIPNAIDMEEFKPADQKRRSELIESSGWDPEKTHILCVANLRHKKGIDLLLEAQNILSEHQDHVIHIVGRPDDHELTERVHKAAKRSPGRIKYYGPIPRQKLTEFYQKADLFVLPSRNEPFGISLIEAVACGLPSVSTRSGGPEMIINENNGILIEPGNSKLLAEALLKMINSYKNFDSDALHQDIKNKFGKERYINTHLDLYASVTG